VEGHEGVVPADRDTVDDDVGHGALAREGDEPVVEVVPLGALVELLGVVRDAELIEEGLGLDAEGAHSLREDHNLVVEDNRVDDLAKRNLASLGIDVAKGRAGSMSLGVLVRDGLLVVSTSVVASVVVVAIRVHDWNVFVRF